MGMLRSQERDRLHHWIRTLKMDLYRPLLPLKWEGFTTMAHLPVEEAQKGDFSPIPEGYVWGHTWEYLWLHTCVTLPESARCKKIVLNLDFSGEATLFVDGRAFGTRRADWVSTPHHYVEDNILTEEAKGGERFDLLCEVYAGHYYPDVGGCATGPVLPGTMADPKKEGERARIGACSLCVWNEDAYQLLMDVLTLEQVMDAAGDDSLRASKIADGLEAFTRCVDFEQPEEARDACYREARALLAPLMQAHNGDTAPLLAVIGNAHLDLAWLWPMQETHRKTARTFAQQLRLLEKYPEYKFIQSQPASYIMCREHYPELYERIRQAIRAGRWIADGAMFVEPDTNMASGEALIRQLVHGKRFYKEELGVDSRVLWLPDTFGYTAALPQILLGCGVKYLVTQKIFWSYNEGDQFPYHYFTWRGMDGSEVTAFLPTSYTYDTRPEEAIRTWRGRVQKRKLDAFLYPMGYGDGGGGPTRDHIEFALRQKNLEGAPRMEMMSPQTFFERMEEKGKPVHIWEGELYFTAHRGTYTSQARVKRNNRRSKIALHEAELWGALAMARGRAYPLAEMDQLWKVLLLHQFHDILPGSSIARVYVEANQAHADLQREAGQIADCARKALLHGEGVTAFNALSFERTALVKLPEGMNAARTLDGEAVPVLHGVAAVKVPPLGMRTVVAGESKVSIVPATARLTDSGAVLENAVLRAELNRLGEVVSLIRKDTGREFVQGVMNHLEMYKDVPRLFDAWDIDSGYVDCPVPLEEQAEMTLVEAEGMTASVRVTRRVNESAWSQVIRLNAVGERVEFDTTVDWHELHRLLKVAFTGTPRAMEALHEMQFGYVARPTHRSRAYDQDRFEVCNHRYTALCDAGHGFAVLNDCKYGVSAENQTVKLTLLRAAASPEMRADQGEHHFTYAVYPWEGDFASSGVTRQGLDLNVPVTTAQGAAETFSLAWTDAPNVLIDTVKPAEDGSGDLVLRLYESAHADTSFRLCLGLPAREIRRCDMLENEQEALSMQSGCVDLHARPFEIITLRVKR